MPHFLELEGTYPGGDLSGTVAGGAISIDTNGDLLRTEANGRVVHFLGLFPLYEQELRAALNDNPHTILDALYDAGISEGAHPGRPSVV
ncbi:suppressor of fused domain protein [Corynebacterium cystitidis]|uniref:Suppressor of fused protein (SUFU) n=1 Tax=Corynebacterium cystitidis DSM 20524 TaxID=1121357 RepID=A0A1H9TB00_9CORY|nr:suppressor of fused domain protein [Corynebacterium cystitidis]WJY83531.1 hypothetical protein CCYS_13235 [Corynebacterium cystitidis DSM 20524]SER94217.1 Suppressor of fused protein (SUFU) [Corynebacterium cystitidis DSM 20524]SNV92263.1 Uncharacterised protein [Corynebacterium cystitidis]